MESGVKRFARHVFVLIGFAAMLTVNWRAITGQINNVKTAAVSNAYPSLFTPASYSYSIWGLIYIMLFIYILFQLLSGSDKILTRTAFWFTLSCAFNIGWLFAWHYNLLLVSAVLMLLLLACLLKILNLIKDAPQSLTNLLCLEFPFGLYAGWITVATAANIAVLLVDLGFSGFLIPDFMWLIIVLLAATVTINIAGKRTLNTAFPATVIWGYVAILVRYLPDFRLDTASDTMWIVFAFVLCLLAVVIRWVQIIIRRLL